MKNNKLSIALITICVICSLIACNNNKGKAIVSDFEKCLGTAKTEKDVESLSKPQLTEVAKCLLGKLDAMKKNVDAMSQQEKEKFAQQYNEALQKSEYKEIIENIDGDKLKELAGVNDQAANSLFGTSPSPSSTNDESAAAPAPPAPLPPSSDEPPSSDNDYDELLDAYEKNTDDYIKLIGSMSNNDVSGAVGNYADVMKSTLELEKKLKETKSKLTPEQASRMIKIEMKMAGAMEKADAKMAKSSSNK